MTVANVKEFLSANGVPHIVIKHPLAFTATSVAGAAHIPGKEMAKVVVVNLDGKPVLAVLPADRHVDLERLRLSAGATTAELTHEREFTADFPGCEVGAMPPFGNLFGLEVLVDPHLAQDKEIAFNAGTHTELIRMAYQDFERLVKPRLVAM